MKAVYTELHRSHDPQFFLVRGVIKRTTEQPERADRLLAGLKAGITIWSSRSHSGRGHGRGCIVPSISAFLPRHGTPGQRLEMQAPR